MIGRFETEDCALTEQALYEIGIERERQFVKWGPQHHPDGTSAARYAATRENSRTWCDSQASKGEVTWLDILREEFYEAAAEGDVKRLRKELVQVAAVASAWVEDIDSRA